MRALASLVFFAIFTVPSFAHPGHVSGNGLLPGFAHPFGGLDHILAMFAVGLISSTSRSRNLWLLPASFIVMMLVGFLIGTQHIVLPIVEVGIGTSVVVYGLMLGSKTPLPSIALACAVGFFAIFHGYAHGAELQQAVSPSGYVIGFTVATVLLILLGLATSYAAGRLGALPIRWLGYALSAVGVGMLAGFV